MSRSTFLRLLDDADASPVGRGRVLVLGEVVPGGRRWPEAGHLPGVAGPGLVTLLHGRAGNDILLQRKFH